MSIDIANESGWDADEEAILDVARFALDKMRIHPQSELSVILVDGAAMEELHIQWMDLPGPTDVMSFPMDELRPGKEGEELPLLTVHGVLHVLGYDHEEPEEEEEMFALQKRILDDWRAGRGLGGISPAPTTH